MRRGKRERTRKVPGVPRVDVRQRPSGNVGYYFQSKRAPPALLYRGLAERNFWFLWEFVAIARRSPTDDRAWFSSITPGSCSLLTGPPSALIKPSVSRVTSRALPCSNLLVATLAACPTAPRDSSAEIRVAVREESGVCVFVRFRDYGGFGALGALGVQSVTSHPGPGS